MSMSAGHVVSDRECCLSISSAERTNMSNVSIHGCLMYPRLRQHKRPLKTVNLFCSTTFVFLKIYVIALQTPFCLFYKRGDMENN